MQTDIVTTRPRSLETLVEDPIPSEVLLLAAIAYGEASVQDVPDEVLGIAFAVANRARAWNKTVSGVLHADPNYTYAANGSNQRFNLLKRSSASMINKSLPMRRAINSAIRALADDGPDPSNDAYWWDGLDLKEERESNPRILGGFKYSSKEHDIFKMKPIIKIVVQYWQIRNKKTGNKVDGSERGRFDSVYISTAACGNTIFWRYNPDFVKSTGAKEYK